MNSPPRSPPPAALEALARGNLVEAIKVVRSSGMDLKEAKDMIDAYVKGRSAQAQPSSSFATSGMSQPLPPLAVDALHQGRKIEAIRLVREQSGLGLKEAKDAVEAYERTHPAASGGLSPGQVGNTGSGLWWIAGLVLIVLVGYLVLRRLA